MNRYSKKKRIHPFAVALIVLLVLLLSAVLFAVGYSLNKLSYITYTPADSFELTDVLSDEDIAEEIMLASNSDAEVVSKADAVETVEVIRRDDNITNILLIGTDNETMANSRSDCMIICSINEETHDIKLVSFMRDIYVKLPDYNGKTFKDQKMTHAFSYGGAQLLINTVEQNFGVEIDKYVRVNFTVMPKLVSALGGIGITLSKSEAEFMNAWAEIGGYEPILQEGSNWLSGNMALIYARCRDDGDYNRTKRQQKVLTLCAQRLKEASPKRFDKFVTLFCQNVQTDMTQTEIIRYVMDAPNYFDKLDSLQMITIPGKNDNSKGQIIDGRYVIVDDRETSLNKIHGFLYGNEVFESESTYTGNPFNVKKSTTTTTTTTTVSASDITSSSDITTTTASTDTAETTTATTATTVTEATEATEAVTTTTTWQEE